MTKPCRSYVERHHKFANVITTKVMRAILTRLPKKASRLDVSSGSLSPFGRCPRHVGLTSDRRHGGSDRVQPRWAMGLVREQQRRRAGISDEVIVLHWADFDQDRPSQTICLHDTDGSDRAAPLIARSSFISLESRCSAALLPEGCHEGA